MQEINVLVDQKNGAIGFNFEEIKVVLKNGLEEYRHMEFTEESKKEAKATVASLRKLKKSVNEKRLEVKNSFMVPYNNFEAQVKELDALIDEPINLINNQIDEFERKRIAEKKTQINEVYASVAGEHPEASELLPLSRIYDSRWENATTTKKAIKDAITQQVERVEKDLTTIRSMQSEFEDKGIEKYKATLELSDAIATMNQYQKQKEEILAREKERAERIAEEAKRIQSASETPVESPKEDIDQNQEVVPESKREEFIEPTDDMSKTIMYEIVADPFQAVQLESAMREYGIKYRRVQ